MSAKSLLAGALIAFAVALAVVVGNRMSAEAMAVVIGVVCGVAASIPMSAIILAMSRRSRPSVEEERLRSTMPVVVVAPPPAAPWPDGAQGYPSQVVPAPRQYRIFGDDTF